MTKTYCLTLFCSLAIGSLASTAHAVSSAELYTEASYPYGRFEARVKFAGGDGVGSFFLWKDGSEQSGVFWNELDLETVWADCELATNALYGDPEAVHTQSYGSDGDLCGTFHTYAYEWTPDYIAWFIDGTEIRRETGADSEAFRDNVPDGMQIHFNLWPGDSTFGGNFDPAIMPVFEYVNWVQYSSYANGQFQLEWREDFAGDTLPDGWLTGDWGSPKNLSTHAPANVAFIDGYAVLSMTADDATGPAGAAPMDPEGGGPVEDEQTDDTPDDDQMSGAAGAAGDDTPNDAQGMGGAAGDVDNPMGDGNSTPGAAGAGGSSSEAGGGAMMGNGAPASAGGADGANAAGPGGANAPQPNAAGTAQTPNEPQAGQPQAGEPAAGGDPAGPINGASPTAPNPEAVASGPAPVPSAAPTLVQTDSSDGKGGCRMGRESGSSLWAWALLALGLVAGWGRRRRRG